MVHGIAFGLAIDITCCADVRIAAKNARFSVKEVDIGIAADIGTLSRLPKAVGNFSWVKEVCLTAREFGAAEALSVGFVSHVVETKAAALEAALALAGSIASKSPVATLGTKELLNHARDHSVPESTFPFYFILVSNNGCIASYGSIPVTSIEGANSSPFVQACDTRLSGIPPMSNPTTSRLPCSLASRRPSPGSRSCNGGVAFG